MNKVVQHLKDSKITTSAAGILALLSLLGIKGDPETVQTIRTLLEVNLDTITNVAAIVLLLFARDPKVLTEPKNNEAIVEEKVKKEVDRILDLVRAENPRVGTTENPT